jgi:DNA (cytosine-5)-methyltransferase 1
MIDLVNFKLWMSDNLSYSQRTISNIASRFKRANSILEWFDNPIYSYHLEQTPEFNKLPADVKAQIKKAVKLYFQFIESKTKTKAITEIKNHKMKVLSLFANIGVAEAYLKRIGFDVVVANELLERRATLYSKIYPETSMVCGDITTDEVKERIAHMSLERGVDIIIATPPCQGMSTAGQQNEDDIRNSLICPVVDLIKKIKPRYVFIENVPLFYSTKIEIDGELVLIPDYLERELSENYIITKQIINTKDYSVPQTRERAITLLSKRGESLWEVPQKDERTITLYDAIGNLPILDPFVTDVTEEKLL